MEPKTAEYLINGSNLKVHYLDLDGVHEILNEVFMADCYRLKYLYDLGYEVKLAVDIGAHMGFFGALVRHYWPLAKVMSFEPEFRLFPMVLRNSDPAYVYTAGIRYDGRHNFSMSPKTGGSMFYDPTVNLNPDIPKVYEQTTVATTTLEPHVGAMRIDLLKIDVEGSEIHIFENMTASVRRNVKRIVGEYHTVEGWPFMEKLLRRQFPHLTPRTLNADLMAPIACFEAV